MYSSGRDSTSRSSAARAVHSSTHSTMWWQCSITRSVRAHSAVVNSRTITGVSPSGNLSVSVRSVISVGFSVRFSTSCSPHGARTLTVPERMPEVRAWRTPVSSATTRRESSRASVRITSISMRQSSTSSASQSAMASARFSTYCATSSPMLYTSWVSSRWRSRASSARFNGLLLYSCVLVLPRGHTMVLRY